MKKLILTLVMVIPSLFAYSQTDEDYLALMQQTLKTEKKMIISEIMELSDAEGEAFWPIYNEYAEKLQVLNTQGMGVVKDFAKHFNNMTEEVANDLIKRQLANVTSVDKLKKNYVKKMMKVLSPQKVIRWYQAENKIDLLVDYELSSEIPLLEVND
ncbi:hypothetical protein R9C00_11830 [Flammeovirgaceae bacterium SG7u.111]|nr:hypothetical protein [Flammeovirgaceae bacterium SG7u.132]WPO38142.1 hypothetical protein R9C00_11830 [Flammeovirgaceae bacterium SG7u.111]